MASTVFIDFSTNTPIVAAWLNDVNNAVYDGNGNLNLQRVVDTMVALRALPKGGTPNAFLTAYRTPVDGGGGPYKLVAQTPGSFVDNGGSIIVANDGGVWELDTEPDWYVEQFGAKGDGGSNDTPAFQAAINALPLSGGYVRMRGKVYGMGGGFSIGNGNAGNTNSTRFGVKIIGQGAGAGIGGTPTILQAIDNGGTSPYINTIISIIGQVDSIVLEGFKIYCLGAHSSPTTGSLVQNGIFAESFTGCTFKNLQVAFQTGVGLWIMGGNAPTGNYNIYNQFHQIGVVSTINGHTGLLMDGVAAVSNDTWLTIFFNCRFDTNSAINAIAGMFKFCDSITFIRCHFVGNNTNGVPLTNCFGCYFNAVGNNSFPSGLSFIDCSILTTFVNELGSDRIGPCTFLNYGTVDNETIPTHPMLKGITATGICFNGYGQPYSTLNPTSIGLIIGESFAPGVDAVTPNNGIPGTMWEYDLMAFNGGNPTQRLVGVLPGNTTIYSSGTDTKWVKLKRLA